MEEPPSSPKVTNTQENGISPSSSPFPSQQISQQFSQMPSHDSQPTQVAQPAGSKIKDEAEDDEDQTLQSQDPVELCCIEGCHRVHSNHAYTEKAGVLRSGTNSMKMCRTHYIGGLGQCCVQDCTVKATNRNWKAGMVTMFSLKKEFVNKPKSKLKVCTDHNAQYSASVQLSKEKPNKRKRQKQQQTADKRPSKQKKVVSEELEFINKTLSTWNESSDSESSSSSDSDSDSSDSMGVDGSSASSSSSSSSSDSEEEEEERGVGAGGIQTVLRKEEEAKRSLSSEDDDLGRSSTLVSQLPSQAASAPVGDFSDVRGGLASSSSPSRISDQHQRGNEGGTLATQPPRQEEKSRTTRRPRKRKRLENGGIHNNNNNSNNSKGDVGVVGNVGNIGSMQEELISLKRGLAEVRTEMVDMHKQLKQDLSEKIESLKTEFIPLIKLQLEQAHQREMIQLKLLAQKYSIDEKENIT